MIEAGRHEGFQDGKRRRGFKMTEKRWYSSKVEWPKGMLVQP